MQSMWSRELGFERVLQRLRIAAGPGAGISRECDAVATVTDATAFATGYAATDVATDAASRATATAAFAACAV